MPALKPKRNYPMMDMTAMCDVAFLLLTFFILTAQFKSQDAATIETPSSISAIKVPDKDLMIISIGKDGKVYFGVDNPTTRIAMLENISQTEGVQFTDKQKKIFSLQANFGVPIRGLSQWLQVGATTPDKLKEINQPGIPTDSTAQNELAKWIYQARRANSGLRIAIKGDNVAKFPVFKDVMGSLQAQNINKFNLVTGTEAPPQGWKAD
ncbi:MAG TPA: biopolymer transporter ExbD [Runella sp.]|nr:biopolymer transporter ExbD [Runella sp.]HAO51524.1 biopolymer transporter ExbD [Runella sp.]